MGYEVYMGQQIVGTLGSDGKMNYDKEKFKSIIREQYAGQQGKATANVGSFVGSFRVVYRWDKSYKSNNDAIYKLWKSNPLAQNRIRQLNALIFGRGFTYTYDDTTKELVDRFWRINRFRSKLTPMGTDSQLFGETFIGLFPQDNGTVLAAIYESNQVEIDYSPSNVDDVNKYVIAYKDEELGKDVQVNMMPVHKYLNELENTSTTDKTIRKVVSAVKTAVGKSGKKTLKGFDGAMIHIKFNNSSAEIRGTSDFRQVYSTLSDYMNFRGDRMAIHQLYGSPMFDIEIDTDDPDVITTRIEELAGFTIGSNPVHNTKEKWTPFEFRHNAGAVDSDEKAMRGLICAGTGFPEHLLFNQCDGQQDESGTFALNKIAETMQDAFGEAFKDMHKFVVAMGGGDETKIDEGQIIFPEISTMSEKAKAETYVLKVGAKICSRKTAALNTGHNWTLEEQQILEEDKTFGALMGGSQNPNTDNAGRVGGRFSSRVNNQDPGRDDGADDRKARADSKNITTQVMGDRTKNN